MAALMRLYHPPDNSIPAYTSSYPFISPSKYQGKLNGKVVLITGAGRGIGRAASLAFAAAGASVTCLSRTQSDLDSLVQEINQRAGQAAKGKAISIAGDVTDPTLASRAVHETQQKLGPVDILINNAGLSRISDLEHEKDVAAAWRVTEVNMLGTMSFTQAVIPSMIARGSGTILNVVSIIGKVKLPFFSAYSAAKAGMIKYTEVIDLELRPKGIYTYAVHPCMTTDTTIGMGCINEEALEKSQELKDFLGQFLESNTDKVDLPADAFVAVCAEEGAKALSGRFVDATYDLGEQIRLAEKKKEGEDSLLKDPTYV